MSEQWHDILITDNDIALDVAGIPERVTDRRTIAQDIKHMFLDSGVAIELIGERSPTQWQNNKNRMEAMVEDDQRVIPGTVVIERVGTETLYITATTVLGPLELYVPVKVTA